MANTYKILGQLNIDVGTLMDLYTVPSSTSTIVSSINVCNLSSTATTFRIALRQAGDTIINSHYIAYDAEILGNEIYSFTEGITLATTDVISIYAGSTTLTFSAFGQEIT